MKNFILPRMYDSYAINNFFKNLINHSKDYAIDPSVNIIAAKGSFPYAYWNGERINNKGNGVFYKEINSLSNGTIKLPIIFNCSNLLITPADYNDTFMNITFDFFHSGSNFIEITDLQLLEWLHNKYPYYYFVLSEKYYLMGNEYENFPDYVKYYSVSALNIELINKITAKNKIILTINQNCFNCNNYGSCDLLSQTSQYNYSEIDPFFKCTTFKDNRFKGYNLEQLNQFIKMGITNFYIQDVFLDNQEYFYFLLDYFIKPEKHREVIEKWERGQH